MEGPRALSDYPNVLAEEQAARERLYAKWSCPRCGQHPLTPFLAPNPWREGEALPRELLRCSRCKHELEPHTGIDVKLGNPLSALQDELANEKGRKPPCREPVFRDLHADAAVEVVDEGPHVEGVGDAEGAAVGEDLL